TSDRARDGESAGREPVSGAFLLGSFESNRESNAGGRRWTGQHRPVCRPRRANTGRLLMDVRGRAELRSPRTSKPTAGILGDVSGRIVPVAPPPVLNSAR